MECRALRRRGHLPILVGTRRPRRGVEVAWCDIKRRPALAVTCEMKKDDGSTGRWTQSGRRQWLLAVNDLKVVSDFAAVMQSRKSSTRIGQARTPNMAGPRAEVPSKCGPIAPPLRKLPAELA